MIEFDKTLLIQFANILVLLIVFKFFLFKPVLQALDKREKTISSLFEKVQGVKSETVTLEKSYEEQTKARRKPVLESRELSMAEAHRVSTGIIEKARKDLSEELARLKAEIGSESEKVRTALIGDVERLSAEAAEKILRRSL